MGYELGDEILRRLRDRFKVVDEEFVARWVARATRDPFKTLVAVIISQNTAERNTAAAYKRLEERVGIEPRRILEAGVEAVAEAIRPAGLQDAKARAIVEAARLVVEKYGGDMRRLMEEGPEAVREALLGIPGIGDKTVDVLLSNWGYPVVAVDTHVRRVARRLGLAETGSYRAVREALHRVFRPERRLEAHLLLILLGRRICRAREPRCRECPLRDLCAYARKMRVTDT